MNLSQLECEWITTDSEWYSQWLELRQRVLRDPLGLTLSTEDLEADKAVWHLIGLNKMDGYVLGGLILQRAEGENCAKIRQVAVREEQQFQGIGGRLMEEAEKNASEEGIAEIFLHSRESSRQFYEKLGYQPQGAIFEEVGIPHQSMLKSLGQS